MPARKTWSRRFHKGTKRGKFGRKISTFHFEGPIAPFFPAERNVLPLEPRPQELALLDVLREEERILQILKRTYYRLGPPARGSAPEDFAEFWAHVWNRFGVYLARKGWTYLTVPRVGHINELNDAIAANHWQQLQTVDLYHFARQSVV